VLQTASGVSRCAKVCRGVLRCVKVCQRVSRCVKVCQGVSRCARRVKVCQGVLRCVKVATGLTSEPPFCQTVIYDVNKSLRSSLFCDVPRCRFVSSLPTFRENVSAQSSRVKHSRSRKTPHAHTHSLMLFTRSACHIVRQCKINDIKHHAMKTYA
jgi:hypothetical protein